jgi:PAS domain S-box-containing protein
MSSQPRTAVDPATRAERFVAISHDLMCACEVHGQIVWSNPAWERQLGWPSAELETKNYLELVHPDDHEELLIAHSALVGGAPEWPPTELRVRSRGGGYRWMLFSAVAAQGEPLVYLCGKDVTAHKEAHAQALQADSRYRALISNLPDTIITLFDTDLRIVLAEGGQLARRGLDPDSYAGLRIADTLPPEHFLRLQHHLRAALAGEPQSFDFDTPEGDVIYRVQAMALYDANGELEGGVMVSRDVTERRRDERSLAARAAELERSNAELAQFAYVASHDLSEPLRMVSSYLQLLRRRYRGHIDDDADAFIDYAVEGAARMRTLIEDLLAYSRAGRAERPLEPVDTAQVVGDVANTLRARAAGEEPVIEWGELPTVDGDGPQLAQLFQNLIGNGIKFVAEGTRPHVRVSAVREDRGWRFVVEDNGIGIDPRHVERVFGMFQRLHTRDEFPGTGIGLAIAKKVVERHGGRIWLTPRETGGSCFEFTLADGEDLA